MGKVRVFNGSNEVITVVTNFNNDTVMEPKTFAEVETEAAFNSDDFYVENAGRWRGKVNGTTGADVEIYYDGLEALDYFERNCD
jgi:hypothetical protein